MTHLFKSPAGSAGQKSRAIFQLWSELARGRIAPKREELSLGVVRGLAAWFWMVDVIDRGADFRFRITGDQVARLYGHRLRGMLLSECPAIPFFENARRLFACCVETRAPLAFGPSQSEYPGKEHLEVEVVALPLSDDGTHVNCIAGTVETWQIGTNTAAGPVASDSGEERAS